MRFIKSTAIWGIVLFGIWIAASALDGVSETTKLGWLLFALWLVVNYVTGSLQDQIRALELRIEELERPRHGAASDLDDVGDYYTQLK